MPVVTGKAGTSLGCAGVLGSAVGEGVVGDASPPDVNRGVEVRGDPLVNIGPGGSSVAAGGDATVRSDVDRRRCGPPVRLRAENQGVMVPVYLVPGHGCCPEAPGAISRKVKLLEPDVDAARVLRIDPHRLIVAALTAAIGGPGKHGRCVHGPTSTRAG